MCECNCNEKKRKHKVYDTCCVADQFCEAPANYEDSRAYAKCFVCGEAVCTKCSTKRKYLQYGKKRICNNCQIEYLDNRSDKIVMRRLYKLAGYKREQIPSAYR